MNIDDKDIAPGASEQSELPVDKNTPEVCVNSISADAENSSASSISDVSSEDRENIVMPPDEPKADAYAEDIKHKESGLADIEGAEDKDFIDIAEEEAYGSSIEITPSSDNADADNTDNGTIDKPENVLLTDNTNATDTAADTPEKKGWKTLNTVFDFLEMFVFTLVAVIIITCFFIRPSVVDGGSMQSTLEDGETLLISNFMYTPERGDIIVLEDYSTPLKKPIVKRIIALGGDTVRVTKKAIYVNGSMLSEPYVTIDYPTYSYDVSFPSAHADNPTLKFGKDYYEITVPHGELFVMGDHRNISKDSRDIGTVDEDAVLGRAILRLFPFNRFGKIE